MINEKPTLEWSAEAVHIWLKSQRMDWPQLPIEFFSEEGKRRYVALVVERLELDGIEGLFAYSCDLWNKAQADEVQARKEVASWLEAHGMKEFEPEEDYTIEIPMDEPE